MFRRIVFCMLSGIVMIVSGASVAKAQWTLWQVDCAGTWNGQKGVWLRYTNTDTGGKYASQAEALQVAQRIQSNYQSQGYKLFIGVAQGTNPTTIYYNGTGYGRYRSPCSNGGGNTYVPPKCTNMWAVVYYYRGLYSTGYAYSSQSSAEYIAAYYQRYGIPASVVGPKCVYPGQ